MARPLKKPTLIDQTMDTAIKEFFFEVFDELFPEKFGELQELGDHDAWSRRVHLYNTWVYRIAMHSLGKEDWFVLPRATDSWFVSKSITITVNSSNLLFEWDGEERKAHAQLSEQLEELRQAALREERVRQEVFAGLEEQTSGTVEGKSLAARLRENQELKQKIKAYLWRTCEEWPLDSIAAELRCDKSTASRWIYEAGRILDMHV